MYKELVRWLTVLFSVRARDRCMASYGLKDGFTTYMDGICFTDDDGLTYT
jgi:hypothetical protein